MFVKVNQYIFELNIENLVGKNDLCLSLNEKSKKTENCFFSFLKNHKIAITSTIASIALGFIYRKNLAELVAGIYDGIFTNKDAILKAFRERCSAVNFQENRQLFDSASRFGVRKYNECPTFHFDRLKTCFNKMIDFKPLFGPDNKPLFGPDNKPLFGPDNKPLFGPDNKRNLFSI
jgi:hypothetical protein